MQITSWKEIWKESKKLLLLSYPLIISHLSHMLVSVADTVMVGHIGNDYVAAAGFANGLLMPFLLFLIGISVGLTGLVAAADSQGKYAKASKLLHHAIWLYIILGCIIALLLLNSANMLHLFGQEKKVIYLAIPYFKIVAISFIPLMIFQVFKTYIEGFSFTKVTMYITFSGSILNILVNYILIYGKLGFPVMYLEGAGWATFTSRIIMACGITLYIFQSSKFKKYIVQFSLLKQIVWPYVGKIWKIGFPVGLEYAVESITYTFLIIMTGWLSKVTLAASVIVWNLHGVAFMVICGLGLAVTIRVGNMFGLQNPKKIREIINIGCLFSFVAALLTLILFVLGDHFLLSLYTSDPTILSIAKKIIIIVGISMIPDNIMNISLSALQGMEDTRFASIIKIGSYWLLWLPLSYYLCFSLQYGITGMLWALNIAVSIAALLSWMRVNFCIKKLKKIQ